MLSVKVGGANRSLKFGVPTPLFEGAYRMNRRARRYNMSPNGADFYLINRLRSLGPITTLHVVQNWFRRLQGWRRVDGRRP